MSKYVKQLITDEYRKQLDGVDAVVLTNVIGLDANRTNRLRRQLAEKNIRMMVVRNTLARRALKGTALDGLFDDAVGPHAVCWGASDIVELAKTIVKLADDPEYEKFEAKGGMFDGQKLSAEQVVEVSKWPSREELIAKIAGQIIGPAATLAGQISGPGSTLAGQVKQKAEEGES
ncbi:50S ribosomal protein L10 [Thermostilla marina]